MMTFISVAQAASVMNDLGVMGTPFLFAFDYELNNAFVIRNPLAQKDVLFCVPGCTNGGRGFRDYGASISPQVVSYADYKKGFDVIRQALLKGDTYLANYTVRTAVTLNRSLEEIFYLAQSPFKLYLPNHFVSFSPERFVRIAGGHIFTYPMKGTIDASIPRADEIILNDKKEMAEHITIVDLLRNDIGMVAKNIRVARFRYIDKIATPQGGILQVSSEIVGDLDSDWQRCIGDILLTLLPAGSICGAPKQATLKAIARAETSARGFYSGVFGYFDGEMLDSAVLIRFIAQCGAQYFFHSGGGITVNSECDKEYQEINQKIYLPL